jgi:hypothetical protein
MPLSTNWFKTVGGAKYISQKDGDPGNAGTEALPFKEMDDYIDAGQTAVVIRNGTYKPLTPQLDMENTISWHGEGGTVKVYGGFGLTTIGDADPVSTLTFRNFFDIFFKNVARFEGRTTASAAGNMIFQRCKIHNSQFVQYGGNDSTRITTNNEFVDITELRHIGVVSAGLKDVLFNKNLYKNCNHTFSLGDINIRRFYYLCNFVGGNMGTTGVVDGPLVFTDCAFDTNFQIDLANIALDGGGGGDIYENYSDGQRFNGVIVKGNTTLSFNNCFWTADMGFNGESVEDYTPAAQPVQSILYNGGNVIGPHVLHQKVSFDDDPFLAANGAVLNDVVINSGVLELVGPATTGTILSAPLPGDAVILLSNAIFTIGIKVFGTTDFLTGHWSDLENYVDPTNLESRYTFDLGIWNGASWDTREHEWNNVRGVEEDNVNVGNGDVDVDVNNLVTRSGTVLQFLVNLRNDGV